MVPSMFFPGDLLGADIDKLLTFNREPYVEDDRAMRRRNLFARIRTRTMADQCHPFWL